MLWSPDGIQVSIVQADLPQLSDEKYSLMTKIAFTGPEAGHAFDIWGLNVASMTASLKGMYYSSALALPTSSGRKNGLNMKRFVCAIFVYTVRFYTILPVVVCFVVVLAEIQDLRTFVVW